MLSKASRIACQLHLCHRLTPSPSLQAVHCCLSGLEMSHGTPELVEHLRSLTAGGRLLCEVLDQLGDKRIVRLTDLTRAPPLDVGAVLRGMMTTGRRVQPSPGRKTPAPTAAAPPAVTVRPPQVSRRGSRSFRDLQFLRSCCQRDLVALHVSLNDC